jgi:glycosyltransferase involved in cell wall biosynthesis
MLGVARDEGAGLSESDNSNSKGAVPITVMTGGIDRPYTFGLAMELVSKGVALELVGSDGVDFPEFHTTKGIRFLNLQGSQRADVSTLRKIFRLVNFYSKLIFYSIAAKPKIFHILWNNKLERFDRTCLTVFYKILGKKVVLTVHNVNTRKRDANDSWLNRRTLRFQYRMADHIFVHTDSARTELVNEFGVRESRITVMPFPINNALRQSDMTQAEARRRLGIADGRKTMLFFGRITPYKGLEYLVEAFRALAAKRDEFRLIIAGRPENDCQEYWNAIRDGIESEVKSGSILLRADHIPDEEIETYFKAADVSVLPYKQIYQSGVLFLSYSFGLPALVANLGGLGGDVEEGRTGFVFKSEDSTELTAAIERYFASELYRDLDARRQQIKEIATAKHSWDVVGRETMSVYSNLLQLPSSQGLSNRETSRSTLAVKDPS